MTPATSTAMLFCLLALTPEDLAPPDPRELLVIKRIYVDKLSGSDGTAQIRDLIISALLANRLFQVTENPDRADAFLRGAAEDLIFTETFQFRDSIDGRAQVSSSRGATTRTTTRQAAGASLSIGEDESMREQVRRHEATAALRIVSKDGDVLWATTKESAGTKFRSASADVATKVIDQLKQDLATLRRQPAR